MQVDDGFVHLLMAQSLIPTFKLLAALNMHQQSLSLLDWYEKEFLKGVVSPAAKSVLDSIREDYKAMSINKDVTGKGGKA